MSIEIVLPFGKRGDVRDLVFTILSKEYPLKIIELNNIIRKRYGKDVTFQGVRKAVLQMSMDGIILRQDNLYSINKEWVKQAKSSIDNLYAELNAEKTRPARSDSMRGEISVFSFDSVNSMMKFWQDLIEKWFQEFRHGDYNVNVYQAAHAWEGLLHLDREKVLMGELKEKGIKSYIVSVGNGQLDKNIMKFYRDIGVKFSIIPASTHFDKSYYIGTYGDMIIESKYPPEITKKLDEFFKTKKKIEDLDLKTLSDIVNEKCEIKLTVIKNLDMAKQINHSALKQTK